MDKRKRRVKKVYDSSKEFHGNHIKDSSTTMTCTNSNKTKMQSRCTDTSNRDSYNNNHNININFINCNVPEQIMNAILPSLPSLNSRNRKRTLSEINIDHDINEFHNNKRLKTARSGAAIRKYLPKNYYNSSNNKNKNYNYFGNELPNDHESDGGWIDINSKTKTHPIHPNCTCTNNFSSFESENKQSNKSPSPCQPIPSPTRSRKNLGNVDIYQSKSKNRLGRKKKQKNKNENKNQSFEKHQSLPWLATIIEKHKLEREKIKKTKKKKKFTRAKRKE